MVVKNPKFEISCIDTDKLPESNLLEVAFVGRSNVGKSSLINALLNRKNLAHSGSRQGMTRLINYYNLDNEIYFVDLPGYGFAKVAKSEMDVWGKVIHNYLTVRPQLYLMILLLDIRHEPTKDDKNLLCWIQATGLNYIVVATKADKLSRMQAMNRVRQMRAELDLPDDRVIVPVSAETRSGIPELWKEIDSFIMDDEEENT